MDIILVYVINGYHCLHFVMYVLHEMSGGLASLKFIADSTTEAEYVAACEAAKEAIWLKKFLIELGVIPASQSPITLYCDNSGAVAQLKEPHNHERGKHV